MTSPQWQNLEQREAYQRLIETVAVLHRLATRLSSRAEIVGAVRQVQLHRHVQMAENAGQLQIKRTLHCVKIYTLLSKRYCLLQDVLGPQECLFGSILKMLTF